MKKVIYISGKITENTNYKEEFKKEEEYIKRTNPECVILNPTILPEGLSYEAYMKIDLAMVEVCDAIFMMSNWKNSSGARREIKHARKLGKEVIYF